MKKFLLLAFCSLPFFANAQACPPHHFKKVKNLIPNPGFEEKTKTPPDAGEWNVCNSWSNSNEQPSLNWPYGSPDYLHTSAETPMVKLPATTFGYVEAHKGDAIMGLIGYHSSTEEFREYLSCDLTEPMKIGARYKISFWITNGEKDRYGDLGCDHMGAKLSTNRIKQKQHEPLEIKPTVEIEETFFSEDWEQFTFEIVADSAYSHFIFGNFYTDKNTKQTKNRHNSSKTSAYYFIDDLEVVCTDEPIVNEVVLTQPDTNVMVEFVPVNTLILIDPFTLINIPNEDIPVIVEGANDSVFVAQNNDWAFVNEPLIKNDSLNVTVYPNPASSEFFISCSETYTYTIYDAAGKVLFSGTNMNTAINVQNLAVGPYILKIVTLKGIVTRIVQVVR